MFDYDGDVNASLEDHRDLVAKVIQETFPNSRCTVRIRKTKAMARPLVSVSIEDGPACRDLVDAIPLLACVGCGVRWAHCGKVLPALGFSVRPGPDGALAKMSQEVWEQLTRDMPDAFCCASTGRLNPKFSVNHRQQVAARASKAHPAQSSATMKLIEQGEAGNIVQMAMEQRREDVERATPMAEAAAQKGLQTSAGAKRL